MLSCVINFDETIDSNAESLHRQAAELLRHPHLQPYVLRCQNASSNVLPIYPLVNSKDKIKRSFKSSGSKDHKDKETGLVNRLERVHPIEGNGGEQTRKETTSTRTEDNLETKMVDLTSYIVESSTSFSGSKDGSTTSESTICSVCKEDYKSRPPKETANNGITSKSTQDSVNEEQELAVEHFQKVNEVNINSATTEVEDTFYRESYNNVEARREDSKLEDYRKSTTTSEGSSITDKDKSMNEERADALESLLELCAQLLKHDKLEELAGVLKPFGKEAVSSRETAIWLTKSLMSAQKFNHEI